MVVDALSEPMRCEVRCHLSVPMFLSNVAAGFPSPADDYLDHPLDFNELLISHPAATYAVRVTGDSMVGAGIFAGDIAIVDRSLTAKDRSVVLAILGGEFTLKHYRTRAGRVWLVAANPAFKQILITEECDFEVWGVVRHTIRVL